MSAQARLRKDFRADEVACPCCGLLVYDEQALDALQALRSLFGVPVRVTSGTRCPAHNKAVGGVEGSGHLFGLAFDIYVRVLSPTAVSQAAKASGFSKIKFYPQDGHYHVEV